MPILVIEILKNTESDPDIRMMEKKDKTLMNQN